ETIEIGDLLSNPQRLANTVWANKFGNTEQDDGWNYRSRGLYQIVGKEQYSETEMYRGESPVYKNFTIDIFKKPNAVWHRKVSAKVAFLRIYQNPLKDPHDNLPVDEREKPRTVVQLLNSYQGDWKKVRSYQDDVGHETKD